MPSTDFARLTFGQQLRHHRQTRGLTVDEVAQQTGLSKGFVSQVENGRTCPSIVTIKLLVDVCIMERDDLDENGKLQGVWELTSSLLDLEALDRRFLQVLQLVQTGVHLHSGPCGCAHRTSK